MAYRNVTPVNLKERIALLQQKAAAGSSSSSHPSTSTVSPGAPSISPSSSAASIPTGSSGTALRERIAKFEKKGGVPVPRGSFGLGAPPPALEQTHEGAAARKKGELYGNRIASVVKSHATGSSGSTSPPSTMLHRHLTGNAEVNAAASRSFISSSSESSRLGLGGLRPGDGSPALMRVRSVSTSSLATKGPENEIIMSGTFDEGETTVDGISLPTPQLFISNDSVNEELAESRLSRRSSASDGTRSHVSEPLFDFTQSSNAGSPLSPSPSQSQSEPAGTPRNIAVPELADDRDHVVQKDHQQMPRADSVADVTAPEQPEAEGLGTAPREPEDESSVKTPVVASFSAQSIERPATSTSPLSDSASPLEASFGIGERVYSETRRLVAIPPSAPKDTTVGSVLDQAAKDDEDKHENIGISEVRSVPTLDISGTQESRGSSETVSASTMSHSTDTIERTLLTPQSTGSGSIRRRAPPAPLVLQQEKYVEPSLDPKVGPKSFRAVVHGKTTESVRTEASQTAVPRARAPVAILRPRDSVPDAPGSPDLSTLLAQAMYLEQKLDKGDTGVSIAPADEDTSQRVPRPAIKIDTNNTSRQSQIAFPESGSTSEGPAPPPKESLTRRMSQSLFSRKSSNRSFGNTSSEDSVPVRTPPSPTFDFAPPSICEEPHEILDEHEKDEHSEPEGRRSISSVLSSPGRSARKKVLSIFGRSGRSGSNLTLPDDLASESTYCCDSNHDSGSDSGHGSISVSVCPSSTLLPSSPIHDDTIQTPSPISPSLAFRNHLRAREDTPDVPRPVSEVSTTSYSSAASRLAVDLFDSFPDVPRSVPNSFDQDRPDELGSGREVVPAIAVRLEDVKEDPDEPHSPPPPTPSKPFDFPAMGNATPPVPCLQADQLPSRTSSRYPPPPYPPSPPRKENLFLPRAPSSTSIRSTLSLPRKSKSKPNLKLPSIPYFSSSSSTPSSSRHVREKSDGSCLTASSSSDMMHAPYPPSSFPSNLGSSASTLTAKSTSTSIFGAISRSLTLSGRRARSRKNSNTSNRSIFGSAHGSSTSLPR